ncbi:MAG: hypothetical protein QW428_04740, partial [Conexivisphaerales archaeon]
MGNRAGIPKVSYKALMSGQWSNMKHKYSVLGEKECKVFPTIHQVLTILSSAEPNKSKHETQHITLIGIKQLIQGEWES